MNKLANITNNIVILFEYYDEDKSGNLSREEVGYLLNDIAAEMGVNFFDEKDLDKFMNILDEDNDDQITIEELNANLETVKQILIQKDKAKNLALCRSAFELFGAKNETAILTKQQIRLLCDEICKGLGMNELPRGNTNRVMRILDENGDGEISFDEFVDNIEKVNVFLVSLAPVKPDMGQILCGVSKKMNKESQNAPNTGNILLNIKQKLDQTNTNPKTGGPKFEYEKDDFCRQIIRPAVIAKSPKKEDIDLWVDKKKILDTAKLTNMTSPESLQNQYDSSTNILADVTDDNELNENKDTEIQAHTKLDKIQFSLLNKLTHTDLSPTKKKTKAKEVQFNKVLQDAKGIYKGHAYTNVGHIPKIHNPVKLAVKVDKGLEKNALARVMPNTDRLECEEQYSPVSCVRTEGGSVNLKVISMMNLEGDSPVKKQKKFPSIENFATVDRMGSGKILMRDPNQRLNIDFYKTLNNYLSASSKYDFFDHTGLDQCRNLVDIVISERNKLDMILQSFLVEMRGYFQSESAINKVTPEINNKLNNLVLKLADTLNEMKNQSNGSALYNIDIHKTDSFRQDFQ